MKQKGILVSCFSRREHLYKTIQAYIYCVSFETGIITEDMYRILDEGKMAHLTIFARHLCVLFFSRLFVVFW